MNFLDSLSVVSNVLGIFGFFVSLFTYRKVVSLRSALRNRVVDEQLIKSVKTVIEAIEKLPADKTTITRSTMDSRCMPTLVLLRDLKLSAWPWKQWPLKKRLRKLKREARKDNRKISKDIVLTNFKLILHELVGGQIDGSL